MGDTVFVATDWASRVCEDVELDTWQECVNRLLSAGGEDAFYRGQKNFEWDLNSSLERALLQHSKKFDERKHGLMTSMVADADTDNWARDVERKLTQHFRQQSMRFDSVPAHRRQPAPARPVSA